MLANGKAAHELVLHDLPAHEQQELAPIFAYESGKAYRTMVFGLAPMRRGAVGCRGAVRQRRRGPPAARRRVGEALARFYGADHIVFPGHGHSLVAGFAARHGRRVGAALARWLGGRAGRRNRPGGEESSFPAGAVV